MPVQELPLIQSQVTGLVRSALRSNEPDAVEFIIRSEIEEGSEASVEEIDLLLDVRERRRRDRNGAQVTTPIGVPRFIDVDEP
jgi:hypothetical protein